MDALVPLIHGMVMNEHRLDLDGTQEAKLCRRSVVNIERYGGLF